MTVISVTITESAKQLVAGFPISLTLSANIPATIFFTTDGTVPTSFSHVYTAPIVLPSDSLEFVLKVFATNGPDTSPVITHTYTTNILHNTRLPHAGVGVGANNNPYDLFPFGSSGPSPTFDYINSGSVGTTVVNPTDPIIPYGYDAGGNPVGTNKPMSSYLNVYSTTDRENRKLASGGNVPGTVTILGRRSAREYFPEESKRSDKLFNPKAMVIFQDATKDDPERPPQINSQFFSMENMEISRDGAPLRAVGLSTPTATGTYIKSYYNPRTQMITAYYRDAATNRWIISTYPYEAKFGNVSNFGGMVSAKYDQGVGKVIPWNLFRYRTLF